VFGNVPEVLLHWRMHKHNAGTASTTAPIQRKLSTAIRISLLEDYGIRLERKEHDALELRAMSHTLDLDQTRDYLGTLEAVSGVSEARLDAPRKELRSVVSEQWDLSCLFSAWQVRGIAAIWLEGCDRLRIPRSPQTLGKILMKRLVGRIRPR
jgi:hypothetical protein